MKAFNSQLLAADPTVQLASSVIDAQFTRAISAQFVSTGLLGGTCQLQVSNDPSNGNLGGFFVPTNWTNLGSPTTITKAGTLGLTRQEMAYRWARFLFVVVGAADTSDGFGTTPMGVDFGVGSTAPVEASGTITITAQGQNY